MPRDSLMTAREVAAYLNCSVSTVRRMASRGQIPHYRFGKLMRFRKGELDGWLGRMRRGHAVETERHHSLDLAQLSLFGDDAPYA